MLSRATIISMAAAAGGVTLAAIAVRENISEEEAETEMDELVSQGVLQKEKKNGETVYRAVTPAPKSAQTQPAAPPPALVGPTQPEAKTTPSGAVKFCRNCGAKIARESKFCEECGTDLTA